jgi:cupin fold WbuC family metalloprotein
MEDNPHRFLNVMIRGTYVTPHRHRDPPKSESFIVLEGELAFFTFDDAGEITSTVVLGRDARCRYPARRLALDGRVDPACDLF